MPLADAFHEEARTVGLVDFADGEDLESTLSELVERARSAYPALPIETERLVRRLARAAAKASLSRPAELATLAIEDLHLALASVDGVPAALEAFEARCAARIRAALAAVAKSTEVRAEVEQAVRATLLVGTPQAPAKLNDYTGQGPLDHFVAVVAQRQAFRLFRSDQAEHRARESAAMESAVAALEPEVALAKQRYGGAMQELLAEALGALDERGRLLLRLNVVRGVSASEIGRMYGVNQSTTSRWLAAARDTVASELRRLMRERLGISPHEEQSIARLVASQLDISMSRVL